MTERWYAIHTIPRSEYLADLKLRALGYKTFFPHSVEVIGQSKRISRFVKLALFRRYIFVCFRPERAHCESAYQINSLVNRDGDYLCRMIYAGVDRNGDRMPFPIPNDVIEEFKKTTDENGELKSRQRVLNRPLFDGRPGDHVKIAEGNPFFGLLAEIESILDDGNRIRVRLLKEFLGAERSVDLLPSQVGQLIRNKV